MSSDEESLQIITQIEESANKRIKEIFAEKEEAINKIEKEAEAKIAQIREQLINEAKKTAEGEFVREKSIKDLEFRLKFTKMRDDIIDSYVDKAIEEIKAIIGTKKYEESLKKAIVEGAEIIDEPELVIMCRKEDKKILTKAFLDDITATLKKEKGLSVTFSLSDNFINSIGGVIIETSDGSIRINSTFEEKLKRILTELRKEIGKMLMSKD